jgi:hypothetical protein
MDNSTIELSGLDDNRSIAYRSSLHSRRKQKGERKQKEASTNFEFRFEVKSAINRPFYEHFGKGGKHKSETVRET